MKNSGARYGVIGLLIVVCAISAFALDRAAIPEKYKWRSDYYYPTVDAWQSAMDSVRADLTQMEAYNGKLSSPQALMAFNLLNEQSSIILSRVIYYAYNNYEADMSDPVWTGWRDQAFGLGSEYGQRMTWVESEMLSIPRDTLLSWTERYPALKPYQKSYADMFTLKAHALSEPEERIIALAGDLAGGPNEIFTQMTSVDMDYPVIRTAKGDSVQTRSSGWRETCRSNPDRQYREDYYKAVFGRFHTFANTFAASIAQQYKTDVFFARAKKYDNTLQANLAPTFVPEEVYTNLIASTRANLAPLHKYEAIRKRVLGVDHYRMWDDFVSLAPAEDKRCSWEGAAEIVVKAVQPLGKDYVARAKVMLDPANRMVDPYTSPNKIGGGWSHNSLAEPARMIFNFDYEKGLSAEAVTTVAHETGHSVCADLTLANQPVIYREDPSLTSEIPSTTNETLLSHSLINEARADYQKATGAKKEAARQRLVYRLDQALIKGRDAFFREVMFAAWELEAHKLAEKGEPINRENLSGLYGDLLKEFYGPALEADDLATIYWAAYPHFYLGYYVYAYAVGEASAVALGTAIRAEYDGDKSFKGATERYLNYLKAGTSKHPIELLRDAGVDMATSAPIEAYIKHFSRLVDELDALTKS
jgi:oligoendopeptidase F